MIFINNPHFISLFGSFLNYDHPLILVLEEQAA